MLSSHPPHRWFDEPELVSVKLQNLDQSSRRVFFECNDQKLRKKTYIIG